MPSRRRRRPTSRFLRRPDIDNWVVWQVYGFGRVDGVRGRVDLDILRPEQHEIFDL